MSRDFHVLYLALALAAPATTFALGLGDLHVNSDLNQPLSAQIDIVNASADELLALSASIANRDMFQRYNAERPAFLSTTTFKVTKNRDGHPILAIHSDAPFTEPLVSLLVDLRWPHGELVREYTLLLDPAELGYAVRLNQATPDSSTAPTVVNASSSVVNASSSAVNASSSAIDASSSRSMNATARATGTSVASNAGHRQIIAHGSLRRVARRAGVRSKRDMHRMMVAIYRANPAAFNGNIYRMHRHAVLVIPTAAEVASISRAEANREFSAQRAAWLANGGAVAGGAVTAMTATMPAMKVATVQADTAAQTAGLSASAATAAVETARAADASAATLNRRVQSLEQSLDELKRLLNVEHAKVVDLQHVAQAPAPAAHQSRSMFVPLAAGLGFLIGLLAALRFRRPKATGSAPPIEAPRALQLYPTTAFGANAPAAAGGSRYSAPVPAAAPGVSSKTIAVDAKPAAASAVSTAVTGTAAQLPTSGDATTTTVKSLPEGEASFVSSGDTTSVLAVDTTAVLPADKFPTLEDLDFDETYVGNDNVKLDYNLVDLDTTAEHVHLPSVLHDRVVVDEMRTNIVEVLVMAIERDPHRSDLRLKLLEVYFTSGAPSRAQFLEVARKLAGERDLLPPGDWDKILIMGRQLAPDDELFAMQADEHRRAS